MRLSSFSGLRAAPMLVMMALLIGWGFLLLTMVAVGNVSRLAAAAIYLGEGWRGEFENVFGSLANAEKGAWVGGLSSVAMLGVLVLLYRSFRASKRGGSGQRRRDSSRPEGHGSRAERQVRYRRNAVLALYLGVPVMLSGGALCLVRVGLFAQHAIEVALGMFVLMAGYVSVIVGCRWWLKAKGWDEAVLVIGLSPILGILIPFVRLLIIQQPIFIWAGMVMMSLVLVVVIFTLPDRSGYSR